MRIWLLEKVGYEDKDEKTGEVKIIQCSRIELFQKLNDRYLSAKAEWETEKNDRLAQAKQSGNKDDLENYARWLALEAPVREARLEAFFADLVVRG